MTALLSQLLELDVAERIELVEALWDSVAATPEAVPIPDWQKEELSARKAALQRNPDSAVSWSEVKQRLSQGAS